MVPVFDGCRPDAGRHALAVYIIKGCDALQKAIVLFLRYESMRDSEEPVDIVNQQKRTMTGYEVNPSLRPFV
jgi:hypothetical protein